MILMSNLFHLFPRSNFFQGLLVLKFYFIFRMKRSSKLCLIINLSCCACILIIIGSIVAIYMFGLQAKMPDPGYCTRQHATIAMECAKVGLELRTTQGSEK